jgi:hypothetical protein
MRISKMLTSVVTEEEEKEEEEICNENCATATKIKCTCSCGGEFHGVKSLMRMDSFFGKDDEEEGGKNRK